MHLDQPNEVNPSLVLGKAVTRASSALGLSRGSLAQIVGYSEATMARVAKGKRGIAPTAKKGELALLLLRVFCSLKALVGDDEAKLKQWINSPNRALNGTPAELIKTAEGLVRTLTYLDGMQPFKGKRQA